MTIARKQPLSEGAEQLEKSLGEFARFFSPGNDRIRGFAMFPDVKSDAIQNRRAPWFSKMSRYFGGRGSPRVNTALSHGVNMRGFWKPGVKTL